MSILVPYIRSSSLGTWSFCQLQYYQIYALGYQNPPLTKAEMGTAIHRVMEILGGCKKLIQDKKPKKYQDDAIGEVKFTKASLYTDNFVDKLIDRCYNYYKSKSENDWDKKISGVSLDGSTITDSYDFVKRLSYKTLKDWNGFYDPRNKNILQVEQHFDLPIEQDWAKFSFEKDGQIITGQLSIKGTIDCVTLLNANTIEVQDFKSGQRKDFATGEVKDYKKLSKDPQLLLYNHALSRLYPEIENRIMSILFIRDGGPFSMCFEKKDDDMFLDILRQNFEEIKNCTNPKPVSKNRNSWKCKYVCKFSEIDPNSGEMICKNVENTIKTYGIEIATKKLKSKEFDPGFYSAPG